MDTTLPTIPLFSLLRESDLWRIKEATVRRSYPKDSVILFEGEVAEALYVVLSGREMHKAPTSSARRTTAWAG